MAARAVLVVVLELLGAAACSLETSPLIGRAPVGNAGDADADADADGDADTDADADGDADDDGGPAPCREGAVRPCGLDVGECRPGAETCRAGVWGACEGAVGPSAEQCDGRDQDCDGLADPDDPEADGPCNGIGARCIPRGGRAVCVYYPICQTSSCCNFPDTCGAGYSCEHVVWDCDVCELCHCNYCYRD